MYQAIGNSETGRDRAWLSQDSREPKAVGKTKRVYEREKVFAMNWLM